MDKYLFWCSATFVSLSYIFRDTFQKISENAKRKQITLFYYNDYCRCLEKKGFTLSEDKSEFEKILKNKNIQELESCKGEYFQFISAYRKYKNDSF
jgi:hypothetical protein